MSFENEYTSETHTPFKTEKTSVTQCDAITHYAL